MRYEIFNFNLLFRLIGDDQPYLRLQLGIMVGLTVLSQPQSN